MLQPAAIAQGCQDIHVNGIRLTMKQHHRKAVDTQSPPRLSDGLFNGTHRQFGILQFFRLQRLHLGHNRDTVGYAQFLKNAAQDHFARSVSGRRIEAVNTSVQSRFDNRQRFAIRRLAGAIGNTVRQAKLNRSQYQPRQSAVIPGHMVHQTPAPFLTGSRVMES